MKIKSTLSYIGINNIIKKISEDNLNKKLDEICRRLSEIAVAELNARGYGNTSVSVTTEKLDHGYSIKASGEIVFFLEYGTGNKAGSKPNEILGVPPVAVYPGSYSDTIGAHTYSQWKETGAWSYSDGSYMFDREQRSGMYFAFKAMRDNAYAVAKEVFESK